MSAYGSCYGIPFRFGAGLLGPASPDDIIQWLKGGTLDGVELIDTIGTLDQPELRDVTCLSFAGVVDILTAPVACNADFESSYVEMTCVLRLKSLGKARTLFGRGTTFSGNTLAMIAGTTSDDKLIISARDEANTLSNALDPVATIEVDTWYKLRAVYDSSLSGDKLKLFFAQTSDHTTADSERLTTGATLSGALKDLSDTTLVAAGAGNIGATLYQPSDIDVAYFSVTECFEYFLEEGSGLTTYDVSGNGNHGTISGATWTTDDGIPSWNHGEGFTQLPTFSTDYFSFLPAFNSDVLPVGATGKVKLTLSFDDASVLDRVFSVRDGPGLYRFEVYQNGGKLGIFISTLGQSVGYAVTTDTFVFEDDTDYVVEFIQDGTGIDITIDGASVDILIVVAVDDSGWWDSALTPTKANIGAFHDLTGYHAGRLYNVSFTTLDDTILASYGIHDGGLNIENSVGVDSTLVVTDADAFWALKIPALLDGTADAQGNPISNPAGYVHNISECSVIQTDFGIVDSIKISRAGFFTDSVAEYLGIDINGYPKYRWEYTPGVQAIYIVYNKDLFYNEESYGDQWIATDDVIGGETYSDVAATKAVTTHFPFVGTWDAVAWSEAFSVAYDSFWVESGEFDKKTYADLLAHYNVNGDKNLWLKLDKDGFVEVDDSVQYPLDKVFTVTEATRNLKYFGTGGNVLYDGGGGVVIDVDGFVVYTA